MDRAPEPLRALPLDYAATPRHAIPLAQLSGFCGLLSALIGIAWSCFPWSSAEAGIYRFLVVLVIQGVLIGSGSILYILAGLFALHERPRSRILALLLHAVALGVIVGQCRLAVRGSLG